MGDLNGYYLFTPISFQEPSPDVFSTAFDSQGNS